MRISDWSSDVCSSDLVDLGGRLGEREVGGPEAGGDPLTEHRGGEVVQRALQVGHRDALVDHQAVDLVEDRRVQIGRAPRRERVCQYVSSSVVQASLKKKKTK